MKSRVRVEDRAEPWGKRLLINLMSEWWLLTTAVKDNQERNSERRIDNKKMLSNQSFMPD